MYKVTELSGIPELIFSSDRENDNYVIFANVQNVTKQIQNYDILFNLGIIFGV